MSFILEALRKAERDRQRGRTPTLEDVTHAPPLLATPARPNRVLWLGALVGVLLALLIAVMWLRPRAQTLAPPPPAPVAAPPPVARAEAAPVPAVPVPIAPPPEAVADPALEADVPSASVDDLFEPADTVDERPAVPPAEPEPEPPATPRAAPETDEPATNAVAVQIEPPAPAVIPALRDMPADYRAAFADLRVDVHVHDDDPARRWVMINGRRQVEGATLPEGPRIVEITADGIVFELRGQQALVPLAR